MARQGIINTSGMGGRQIFQLKEAAKAAGWTVPRSSDGITYFPSSDGITTSAAANGTAGNMSNARAWFVLRDPANIRSLCFQRGTGTTGTATDHQWRVKIAIVGNDFVGGSPSALQTPSAVDEQYLIGDGTDSAPTFLDWFKSNTSTEGHAIFDATPYGGVYPFWFINVVGTVSGGALGVEPLQIGSYPTEEVDPAAYLRLTDNVNLATGNTMFWWHGYGTPNQRWVTGTQLGGSVNYSIGSDTVDIYGVDPLYRYTLADSTANYRKKGASSHLMQNGIVRGYRNTYDRATDCYISLSGNVVAPFLNGQAPTTPVSDRVSVRMGNDPLPVLYNPQGNFAYEVGNCVVPQENTPPVVFPDLPDGSTILPEDALTFDITGMTGPLESILISVRFDENTSEMAYNGGRFTKLYKDSTITPSGDNATLILRRAGGWKSSPTVSLYGIKWNGGL